MDARTEVMLKAIRDLPPVELTATTRSPRGSVTRTYKGPLLYDYVRSVGMLPAGVSPVGLGNHYFVATAEDGFKVALSFAEVAPRFTAKQVLLAYEQDGEPLRVGVRLLVPGDDLGGRSITGVVDIALRWVEAEGQATRPRSESLAIGGLVEKPQRLGAAELARFASRQVETPPAPRHGDTMSDARRYAGVPVWDLLERAVVKVDAAINEDILSKVIVARSTDGYVAVIAAGELDPRFMNGDILVATASDGGPLAVDEARFRLVVPFDRASGRSVKSLAGIEVIQA